MKDWIYKAYSYRLYPNEKQRLFFEKTFGCTRFVYNATIDYKSSYYKAHHKGQSWMECNNWVTHTLEPRNPWLRDTIRLSLTNAVRNANIAYQRFFNHLDRYPKFKNKKGRQSFTVNQSADGGSLRADRIGNRIHLPKIKWVKAKIHRDLIGTIKSLTIERYPDGSYYGIFLTQTDKPEALSPSSSSVGIDLGIKNLATLSDGRVFANPKSFSRRAKQLARAQSSYSRSKKGSMNAQKKLRRVDKIYRKMSNQQTDYFQKLSTMLIRENQTVCMEDLDVFRMYQNKKIAPYLKDVALTKFTLMLEYKARWYGRSFVKIGHYFPSSQLCSSCGFRNKKVRNLSVREWTCPKCGAKHDRDVNAAQNILREGLRLLEQNRVGTTRLQACGDCVRPALKGGRRSGKQENNSFDY